MAFRKVVVPVTPMARRVVADSAATTTTFHDLTRRSEMRTITTLRAVAVVGALALPVTAPVAAASSDGPDGYLASPSLYIGGFYLHPDAKRSTTKRGEGWTIGAGLPVWRGLTLELMAFTANLDTGTRNQATLGNSDFYQRGGGLDAVWNFRRKDQFNPFVLGGLGAVYDDVLPEADKTTSLYYNAGVGFTQPIFGNPTTRLRGDARYIHDRFDGGRNDWRVGLALEISLGGLPEPRVIVKEVKVPVEVVQPVPAPVPVAPPPPKDTDGDGVNDDRDRCPDTIHGAKVDENGCAVEKQTVTLRNIQFDFNSARLRPSSDASLDEAVRFLSGQPQVRLQIAGHTDNIGSDAVNLKISRERAEAVQAYLVSHGVDASRLTARGYGESLPLTSNATEEGRQKNRRVEMIILSSSGQ